MRGGRVDFAATEQSRNANTGQFLVKECRTASSSRDRPWREWVYLSEVEGEGSLAKMKYRRRRPDGVVL